MELNITSVQVRVEISMLPPSKVSMLASNNKQHSRAVEAGLMLSHYLSSVCEIYSKITLYNYCNPGPVSE